MVIKTLKRSEAHSAMEEWKNICPRLPEIDSEEYIRIRKDLSEFYRLLREKYSREYDIDVHFGINLYQYLWSLYGFSTRVAANDDFWRYLSVKVIPHIVAERWGKDNDEHFWRRSTRIWLGSIWWYIHLSWQGNIENTSKVLKSAGFDTDTILNLVERAGRKGYYTDVYRYIMYFYSRVPQDELIKYRTDKKHRSLFRMIMKLNTARTMVIEPGLYLGGELEYVRSLYNDLNVGV